MKYNPEIHHRKSIRLKNYNYSQAGLYFITICTQNRLHLFGEIVGDAMVLNDAGKILRDEWFKSEKIRDEIKMHELVVMPNHLHGIVEITVGANGRSPSNGLSTTDSPSNGLPTDGETGANRANGRSPIRMQPRSIGSLVAGVKSSFTKKMNHINGTPKRRLWQRNYWEHIIRNEDERNRITQYIMDNPQKWALDKLNGGIGNAVMEQFSPYNKDIWMV